MTNATFHIVHPRLSERFALAAIAAAFIVTILATPARADGAVMQCEVCHPTSDARSYAEVVTGSATCLSCHDGAVATGVHNHGGAALAFGVSSMNHPVGIEYRFAANARGDLRDERNLALASQVTPGDLLVDGRVECTSCHDHHHEGVGQSHLRVWNTGSSLCLTCHDK